MAEDDIVVYSSVTTSDPFEVRKPRPPTVIHEHWCEHEGCKNWGSFGYSNATAPNGFACSIVGMERPSGGDKL